MQIIIGLTQMPKINISETPKILIWILSLANISREQEELFLGLIWWDLNVDYFWADFWGFQLTSIQVSEI